MRPSHAFALIFTILQILNCHGVASLNRQTFFDLELLRYSAENKGGNVMISPASIKSVLALILEGAYGQTAAEIKNALRVSPERDDFREELKVFLKAFEAYNPSVKLQNANALFISNKLKLRSQYKAITQGFYHADIQRLNFNLAKVCADRVNKWLDEKTHGMIPSIIEEDEINPATKMMVTNALFFKAPWKNGFNHQKTVKDCFNINGVCRNVAMMNLLAKLKYGYVKELKSHVVELPYQGDRYSMYLLVPQDRSSEYTLLRDLPNIGLTEKFKQMEYYEVILRMPKFDVEYRDDLVGPLKNMHISSLFSQNANLSGIFGKEENANVNSLLHSVHMKVDEAGTVAAAASASAVVPLSNDQVRVDVNQPFLFFIMDNLLDVILFEGKIEEPSQYFGPDHGDDQQQAQIPQQIDLSFLNQDQSQSNFNRMPSHSNFNQVPSQSNFNQAQSQSSFNQAQSQSNLNQVPSQLNFNQAQSQSSLNQAPLQTEFNQAPSQSNFNQAPSQTSYNQAPVNYYTSSRPITTTIDFNQANPTQSSYYQEILNHQAHLQQVLNRLQQPRSQSAPSTSQPTTLPPTTVSPTTTKDPFKIKSSYCIFWC